MKFITASVVFKLIDMIDKNPINGAVITCEDYKFGCIKKDEGCYVFTDMPKGDYTFNIQIPGFVTQECSVSLADIEPLIVTVPMQFSADNPNLANIKKVVFTLTQNGKILPDKEAQIKINTRNPYLRVVEPIAKQENLVKLSYDFDQRILNQSFIYDKKANTELTFSSYDHTLGKYIMNNTFKTKVIEGGLLLPIWDVKSDKFGRIVLPISSLFVLKNELDVEVSVGKKSIESLIDISNDTTNLEIVVK